jgi:hypothetical protein
VNTLVTALMVLALAGWLSGLVAREAAERAVAFVIAAAVLGLLAYTADGLHQGTRCYPLDAGEVHCYDAD